MRRAKKLKEYLFRRRYIFEDRILILDEVHQLILGSVTERSV